MTATRAVLSRLFPARIDNAYRGHRLAIWLLIAILALKAVQGANSIFNTRQVMTTADGIPLASYGAGGAQAAIALFALLGFYLLMLPLQGVVVLVRYRAMIPFMYLILLIAQIGVRAVSLAHPLTTVPSFGLSMNLAILAATALGFVLSLRERAVTPAPQVLSL